jgi:hypothetical protein
MAQTAARLVDHVIPPVPVRQSVISVPKRQRWFLSERAEAIAALAVLREAEKRSHDTSRIVWAKLLARIAEAFPLVYVHNDGDVSQASSAVLPGIDFHSL